MAITRTPIVDDDGSGQTGTVIDNAWKQELYNQIDGAITPVTPTQGTWTPVDGSGVGLVFTGTVGRWFRVGNLITIWGQVIYPATSNTGYAVIAGLPFPNGGGIASGFYTIYGIPSFLHLSSGGQNAGIYSMASGAPRQNVEMSNGYCIFTGSYLAA